MKYLQAFLFVGSFLMWCSCGRPLAQFTYQQVDTQAPAKVVFENTSTKSEAFEWDFGDGHSSQDKEPVHTFTQAGFYEVVLKAMKGNKEDIHKELINIEKPEKSMVKISTSQGDMLVELYDQTPQHRDNFLKLAKEGYFDDLLFHRVINEFMIQGGDPDSRNAPAGKRLGSGGPGYTIPAEFNEELYHVKGALSAARQGDAVNPKKASSGSQFYIVQGKPMSDRELDMMEARSGKKMSTEQREAYKTVGGTPFLDGQYTVFGRVVQGIDVIDKIATQATDAADRPKEDITMKVEVIE